VIVVAVLVGVLIGLNAAALWRVLHGPSRAPDKLPNQPKPNPFMFKKESGRRKPVSHDEHEQWEREQRAKGSLL
jgi:hypothetical protein